LLLHASPSLKQIICLIFLLLGLAFLAWGLAAIGLERLVCVAPIVGVSMWLVLRLVRRVLGCLGRLLPIALGLGIVLVILVGGLYAIGQLPASWSDISRPPILFIAAIICFIIFGLCISGPRHSTTPAE
jgi:hypothetical protein